MSQRISITVINFRTGTTVEAYNHQAASPYYSTKIDDFTDATGSGSIRDFYVDVNDGVKITVLITPPGDSAQVPANLIGLKAPGVADGEITPAKTTWLQ